MRLLAAALLACGTSVLAQDGLPVIRDIQFVGNETTRPETMLREMVVAVGDPSEPAAIERSRQGILDLGLFKSVTVAQEPMDWGVRLVVTVEEKWYLLPIPRLDANSEGERSYGMQLRWYNFDGLNHTVRAQWFRRDEARANRGVVTTYSGSYYAPFVFDSPYNLGVGGGRQTVPVTQDAWDYLETIDTAYVGLSRNFGKTVASQGWNAGTDLTWTEQDTSGPAPPDPYGHALALGLFATYRSVHLRVYSDEGTTYGGRFIAAGEHYGSNYSLNAVTAFWSRFLPLGATPHQSLHLHARGGSYHGGPQAVRSKAGAYSLGGASGMRGYPGNTFEGDAYYHLATEFLRPVGWPWLRALLVAEVGDAWEDAHAVRFDEVHASVGIGLRVRVTFLVNLDLEAGVAWPLEGGGSRFFATSL